MISTLYKDSKNAKLAGVCAGLGQYFNVEAWMIRIALVSVILLGGYVLILVYIAMAFMLENKPKDLMEENHYHLKNKPWKSGQSPSQLLQQLERQLDVFEHQLKTMEAYVTSDAYKVNRDFKNL